MKTVDVLLSLLCLAASVSAFAPSSSSTSSSSRSISSTSSAAAGTVVITQPVVAHTTTTLHALVDSAFGVSIETGNKVPPLGRKILEDAGPDGVKWFQNAEIKHGRIAMVAVIGFWVQKLGVHFPLYLGPSGSNGFHPSSEAHNWLLSTTTGITFQDIAQASPLEAVSMVPEQGWAQILLVAGWFECIAYQKQWADEGEHIPGDYGYDPLGFTKKEGGIAGKEFESLRLKEIKNGRVAMLTIAAWVSNECIPGALPTWHP